MIIWAIAYITSVQCASGLYLLLYSIQTALSSAVALDREKEVNEYSTIHGLIGPD